jgi:FAD/FMN-containing dehydrogenase
LPPFPASILTIYSVGVGGLTLHGGYGFSSRAHGLTLDALVEAEVVLANSSVVVASETQNPDLFWALRGAGGSFGIVTKFKFQTFEAPASNVVFTYAPVNTTRESIKSLITQLQEFSIHDQPAELNVRASLEPRSSVSVTGVYHGHKSDFDALMQPLAQRLGLVLRSNQTLGWIKSLEHHAPGSLVPSRVPTDNMVSREK